MDGAPTTHLRLTPEAGTRERPCLLPPAPALWIERAERLPALLRMLEDLSQDDDPCLPGRLRHLRPVP